MRLDGNFYKKEVSERTNELSARRNNIERYLLTRYGMNPQFATKVADVLEKTSLIDNLLSSGIYDSVIEMAVQQMTRSKSSSHDAKHIRESERDEHLYSQQTTGSQSQNNLPQQNATPLSEEEMHRKQQYLEQLQKLQEEAQQQREAMMARCSGRR